jgi:hypothetical protein
MLSEELTTGDEIIKITKTNSTMIKDLADKIEGFISIPFI